MAAATKRKSAKRGASDDRNYRNQQLRRDGRRNDGQKERKREGERGGRRAEEREKVERAAVT